MKQIFSEDSIYKKRARFIAILWTLLIFILCFLPGRDIPDMNIPFIDKWAHLILFGIFSFLWLCSSPSSKPAHFTIIFLITVFTGWLVEYIQGHYVPNRTQDMMDILADSLGGLTGIIIFGAFAGKYNKAIA